MNIAPISIGFFAAVALFACWVVVLLRLSDAGDVSRAVTKATEQERHPATAPVAEPAAVPDGVGPAGARRRLVPLRVVAGVLGVSLAIVVYASGLHSTQRRADRTGGTTP